MKESIINPKVSRLINVTRIVPSHKYPKLSILIYSGSSQRYLIFRVSPIDLSLRIA